MQQRDVVEAVADQAQVGEHVADRLRVVVVAADRGDRLDPRRRERRLVDRGVGARLEQDRDVARAARAGRDEVADARRDPGRLGVARRRVARRAGDGAAHDGELDARPVVLGRRAGGDQRLVAAREAAREQRVDGLQHARVRAVVAGQADDRAAGRAHLRPAAAEDVHVGAAEAVDRLALVADGEAAAWRRRRRGRRCGSAGRSCPGTRRPAPRRSGSRRPRARRRRAPAAPAPRARGRRSRARRAPACAGGRRRRRTRSRRSRAGARLGQPRVEGGGLQRLERRVVRREAGVLALRAEARQAEQRGRVVLLDEPQDGGGAVGRDRAVAAARLGGEHAPPPRRAACAIGGVQRRGRRHLDGQRPAGAAQRGVGGGEQLRRRDSSP